MRACRFGVSERVACTRCTSAPSAEPLPAPAGVHAWSAPNHSDAQSRTHRFGACLVALHQVFFHPHARVGRTAATSAPGLGSPLPHLRRDWAHPCHICARTGLTPATSAPGLGSPRPHLRRDCALDRRRWGRQGSRRPRRWPLHRSCCGRLPRPRRLRAGAFRNPRALNKPVRPPARPPCALPSRRIPLVPSRGYPT